jgi:hypothetical protein
MKKLLQLSILGIAMLCSATAVHAQSTLIHYWNFNNLLTAYNNPNIPPLVADYTILDTSKVKIIYVLEPGTSPNYLGYIDNVASADTTNNRLGAVAGQALRVRNPTDSMELRFYIPTTGYTGIVLKYALESSSTTSGDSTELFDYSVDSGKTWKTSGLTVNGVKIDTLDTTPAVYQGSSWGLVTITFGSDLSVENNPGLVFRMKFTGNSYKTSGNNRLDNVTVEGTGASKPPPATLAINGPLTSSILVAGRHTTVSFKTTGAVTQNCLVDYSTDGGTTWSNIGTASGAATSFDWLIPSTPTTDGMIRVRDSNNVTGTSGKFTIYVINKGTNTLIHYWDFNNFQTAYNNPNIPAIITDFSVDENAVGSIVYTLEPGTSKNYLGYLDNVAGDTLNTRLGQGAGEGLRVRNPTDSMELRLKIPTSGYRNITIKYDLQASSLTAQQAELFDYSIDGGNTWKTSGLNMTIDSATQPQYQQPTSYGLVALNFGSDSSVNDNALLVFRIKFAGMNSGTSGNHRLDNITVEGNPLPASVSYSAAPSEYSLFPNPSSDHLYINTPTSGLKTVSIMDITGRVVLESKSNEKQFVLNTSALRTGAYFIHIMDAAASKQASIKFVKE